MVINTQFHKILEKIVRACSIFYPREGCYWRCDVFGSMLYNTRLNIILLGTICPRFPRAVMSSGGVQRWAS